MNTFLQALGVTALVLIGLVVLLVLAAVGLFLWVTKVKLPQWKASIGPLPDAAKAGLPRTTSTSMCISRRPRRRGG